MLSVKFTLRGLKALCIYAFQVIQFLKYVKDIYKKLGNSLPKIFEHRMQIKIRDMSELNIESVLDETFTSTTIVTEKKNQDNQNISVSGKNNSNIVHCNTYWTSSLVSVIDK